MPRSELELREARRHLTGAAVSARISGDAETLIQVRIMIDVLDWALGAAETAFERMVIKPCEAVDRAARQ